MDTKKLRQKILDLAIRGKLVPQDPNDEPASVLLERIRAEKECLIKEGKIKRSKKTATDEEIEAPFEIPESWEWTSIGDICNTCLGKMLDKQKNQGINQYYLRNVNVRWGTFDLSDLLQMPFEEDEEERYSICKGDLVVCEGGEPGRCAIWNRNESIKFQKALHRVRCHNGVNNRYIRYALELFATNGLLENLYTGSTIKHLTGESLNSLSIPLPPLHEQKRIVTEVERWFAVIDVLESNEGDLVKAIDQAKSKILDLAIHGKLVPQDLNDEPAIELLKRINPKFEPCDEDLFPFRIPNNWIWCRMIGLCSFLSRGKSPQYSDERKYPVFAQKCNLYNGDISLEQARFLDPNTLSKWSEEYKLRDGDVLVNSTGTGTVGRTRLFHSDCLGEYPFVVPDSHVSVIRTVDNIESNYIYSVLSSKYGQEYIEDNLAGSTNQKELYIGVLENMLIPIPPHNEQLRIVAKIEELFAVLDEIKESLETL